MVSHGVLSEPQCTVHSGNRGDDIYLLFTPSRGAPYFLLKTMGKELADEGAT